MIIEFKLSKFKKVFIFRFEILMHQFFASYFKKIVNKFFKFLKNEIELRDLSLIK